MNQRPKLHGAVDNARVEIELFLSGNKIHPFVPGRKNYLFGGLKRIAIMYSFIGTDKTRNVNPYEWMKGTLEKLPTTKMTELQILMPGYEET